LALDKSGWNSQWKFIPYWDQKNVSLPEDIYTSIYQSPDKGKVLLVLMNTSGKDQDINLPMAFGKSTFKTATAIYPDQPVPVKNGIVQGLTIHHNNFRAFVLSN
jgi:hypothetical protein